jgi:glycosyltransferase involved in cell wall biosynthesis
MIVVDISGAQSPDSGHRGIGRYTAELATALRARHPDLVDAFAFNPALALDDVVAAVAGDHPLLPFPDLAGRWVEVFHASAPFEPRPLDEVVARARIGRLVVTCFDLIPYLFPDRYFRLVDRARYLTRLGLLSHADAIVTLSQASAFDLEASLGIGDERVTIIGAGVGEQFVPPTQPLDARMAGLRAAVPRLRSGFVLLPTGMDWRKNPEVMIAAYGRLDPLLRSAHQLVITAHMNQGHVAWLESVAAEAGVLDDVLVTGFVADDVLVELYQSAALVVFPSRYEGFGLPVLEARRCGARVICSNVSSLPEVMPLKAATFDPEDASELARLVERALVDPRYQAVLDAAPLPQFGWDRAADLTAEVYERQRQALAARRRRVAIATLLPPSGSGVADHTARLATAMAELADVTCYVAGHEVGAARHANPSLAVEPLSSLAWADGAGLVDGVLYPLGNNTMHRPALDMLAAVPGDVLAHDVELSFLLDGGDVALALRPATSVLVQSGHAAAMLAGVGVHAVDVGPHPMAAPRPSPGTGAPLAAGRLPEGRFAVVGPHGRSFVPDGFPVVATGAVDDDGFATWLDRATVAVQLRRRSNGESSGVVAHTLARGIPTIVTDIGAMAELPDDAVVKVPADIAPDGLADVIVELLGDASRRAALRAAALRFAAAHGYRQQAQAVLRAMFS